MSKVKKWYTFTSVLSFILIAASCALLAASMLSNEWMKNSDTKIGLWETCTPSTCTTRSNVLEFKTINISDIVLLINICAVGFSFTAFLVALVELCTFKSRICSLVFIASTIVPAAFASILLVVFSETMFKRSILDYGWGFITAFAGMAISILASVFHFISFYLRPEPEFTEEPIDMGELSSQYFHPEREHIATITSADSVPPGYYNMQTRNASSAGGRENGRLNQGYSPYRDHMYMSESRY